MKRLLAPLFWMLLLAVPLFAQTSASPSNVPTPTQSNLNFQVGGTAMGVGASTPATDVTLDLNPNFTGYASNFTFHSDNFLAPGAGTQYYGGGGHYCLLGQCPKSMAKIPGVFAPLSISVGGSLGVDRIVPSTGPSSSHIGFMAGVKIGWTLSNGMNIDVLEVKDCHFPGAPFGNNSICEQGGVSYVWGSTPAATAARVDSARPKWASTFTPTW